MHQITRNSGFSQNQNYEDLVAYELKEKKSLDRELEQELSGGCHGNVGGGIMTYAWFHGTLPSSDDAEKLLKRNGQFVVRSTIMTSQGIGGGECVLSARLIK